MMELEMLFATEGQLITEKGNPPEEDAHICPQCEGEGCPACNMTGKIVQVEEEYPGQNDGLDPEDALSADYHNLHSYGQFVEQCWKCKEEYLEECHDRDIEWDEDLPL